MKKGCNKDEQDMNKNIGENGLGRVSFLLRIYRCKVQLVIRKNRKRKTMGGMLVEIRVEIKIK